MLRALVADGVAARGAAAAVAAMLRNDCLAQSFLCLAICAARADDL